MLNQSGVDKELPHRPLHASIVSLGTNASGVAGSTISYAASELSGISQFPAPPTDIPTPTLSRDGTPTSYKFTIRLPPSLPDYEPPSRFHFDSPTAPRSPSSSIFSIRANGHDSYSVKSVPSPKYNTSDATAVSTVPEPRKDPSNHVPSLPTQPSASYQRTRPLVYRKNPLPHPPISERALSKRPETPQSVAAASSLLDWSDATSGISIDPTEERLLTTSFITSLLSQVPEPFPGDKLRNVGNRVVSGTSKGSHQMVQDETMVDASRSHRSIPPFYPSDLLSTESGAASNSLAVVQDDRRSNNTDSRRASREYSETGHTSDGHVQSAIRIPSITVLRGGVEAHPVGVAPALRIPSTLQKLDSTNASPIGSRKSVVTSTSMTSKPPVHRADAPRNVQHTDTFNGDAAWRNSEGDFEKSEEVDHRYHLQQPGVIFGSSSMQTAANFIKRTSQARSRSKTERTGSSSTRTNHQRNQSIKSVVSSLVSRISHNSAVKGTKYIAWLRQRPLPPIPIGNSPPRIIPNVKEIQSSEEAIPLPTLAKRAENLSGMLSRGRFPDGSEKRNDFRYQEVSVPYADQPGHRGTYIQINTQTGDSRRASFFSRVQTRQEERYSSSIDSPSFVKATNFDVSRKKRRVWVVMVIVILGITLAIALPVGLSQRRSVTEKCNGNQTGASCTLDATCVCTSTSGSCRPLARSMFLLLKDVNDIFASNFTGEKMSDAVVSATGVPADGLCVSQALLIDVEPGVNSAAAPNRTKWAQTAMLWNLGMSEDISIATTLQTFVSTAPWSSLSSIDGPDDDADGRFAIYASGFTFDFASQTVTPPGALFRQSSPSDAQAEPLSNTALTALDRMYSNANASSTQRERALANYWTSVLQRQRSELETFKSAVRNSPFLIPFDATASPGGSPLTNLMSNTSTSFPVPISCYPALDVGQLSRIRTLETGAFGLDPPLPTSDFSQFCFRDRPVYGVVDLLRLRLPFTDGREGVALQASALSQEATFRATIYSGEVLSALPGGTDLPDITAATTDPREFGTVNFLDHVLLNYLSSISNVSIAMDLVSHILSSDLPPDNPVLANSRSPLPVLEFALFGPVSPQDIAFSVSSFSTPTGSLFFGSNASEAFRSWALVNTSASIVWTETSFSSEVVHEGSSRNENFESVWEPASELAASGPTDADAVRRVTSSLRSLGLFSP